MTGLEKLRELPRASMMLTLLAVGILVVAAACSTNSEPSNSPSNTLSSVTSSPAPTATAETVEGTGLVPITTVAVGAETPVVATEEANTVLPAVENDPTATAEPLPIVASASGVTITAPPVVEPPRTAPIPTATPLPARKIGYNVGEQAPDFTLFSVTGQTYTISEATASGKSVLLYFFASW